MNFYPHVIAETHRCTVGGPALISLSNWTGPRTRQCAKLLEIMNWMNGPVAQKDRATVS